MELTLGHIIALLSVMAGVISVLWYAFIRRVNDSEKSSKALIDQHRKEIDHCEERHVQKDAEFGLLRTQMSEAQKNLLDLTGKCKYLQGRQDAVEQISARVDNSLGNIEATNKRILAAVAK